jgi:hypothetical protein
MPRRGWSSITPTAFTTARFACSLCGYRSEQVTHPPGAYGVPRCLEFNLTNGGPTMTIPVPDQSAARAGLAQRLVTGQMTQEAAGLEAANARLDTTDDVALDAAAKAILDGAPVESFVPGSSAREARYYRDLKVQLRAEREAEAKAADERLARLDRGVESELDRRIRGMRVT